jgi:hypothetical protein
VYEHLWRFSLPKFLLSQSGGFAKFLSDPTERGQRFRKLPQFCNLLRVQHRSDSRRRHAGSAAVILEDPIHDDAEIPGPNGLLFRPS